jgi:hypothetical protein
MFFLLCRLTGHPWQESGPKMRLGCIYEKTNAGSLLASVYTFDGASPLKTKDAEESRSLFNWIPAPANGVPGLDPGLD